MPIFSHNFSGLLLGKLKKKYEPDPEPLVIKDSLGTFILTDSGRKNSYCGEVELLGISVSVYLETDGNDEKTAFASLQSLRAFKDHGLLKPKYAKRLSLQADKESRSIARISLKWLTKLCRNLYLSRKISAMIWTSFCRLPSLS